MDESSIVHRARRPALIKLTVSITILITVGALAYAEGLFRRMPSDSELRSKFLRQHSAFAKLVVLQLI